MIKRLHFFCLLLVLSIFLGACKSGPVLEAYLVDSFHQKPLSNFKVIVDEQEYTSDHQGSFVTPSLSKDSVKIVVPAQDRYEEFSDQLVLYQRRNVRKFLIDARHPLNLPHELSAEPYSYRVQIHSGKQGPQDRVSITLNAIPSEQSYEFSGSYTDEAGQKQNIHMIQIGFNFWFMDEWNNWQFTSTPPQSVPLWGMIIDPFIQAMHQFYQDRDYDYEVIADSTFIKQEELAEIQVKAPKNKELFEDMKLYMIKSGSNQGNIRKATVKLKDHPWLGTLVQLEFETLKQALLIAPPEITR